MCIYSACTGWTTSVFLIGLKYLQILSHFSISWQIVALSIRKNTIFVDFANLTIPYAILTMYSYLWQIMLTVVPAIRKCINRRMRYYSPTLISHKTAHLLNFGKDHSISKRSQLIKFQFRVKSRSIIWLQSLEMKYIDPNNTSRQRRIISLLLL